MNIKQIVLSSAPLFLLVTLFSSVVSPADTSLALTTAESKACYEQWAGGYTGSAGDGTKLTSDQFNNFENKSKCNNTRGGSCKKVPYTDGAVIQCQRKDGKYDSGAGWDVTSGGGTGDTGDDGEDNGGLPADPSSGNDCGGVKTAIITCDADNSGDKIENNGIWALLLMVLNIMTAGVGILAVAGIVYGAILYTTAEDKADQVKKATDIITNVVIGLILFALMWAGLNFIVPGGVFA